MSGSDPSISVVTPCLNQAEFVEATIRSVLDADVAPDEYVVVDGASADGSADIIRAHSDRLTWWVSEPDSGQYAAIQKGFDRCQGDVMAWLNAGDVYMPWTLSVVKELFSIFPEIQWLTTQRPMIVDERGRVVACEFVGGFAAASFRAGVNLPGGDWFARAGIQQESTFWRRELWTAAGSTLATGLQYAGDFELWLRFFEHAVPYSLDSPLAGHRVHRGQKTETLTSYIREAKEVQDGAHNYLSRRATSTLRGATYQLLGRRPLRRLPSVVARPLGAAGLLHETRTIVWSGGAWRVTTDYAV
jgi:hypothetical protein